MRANRVDNIPAGHYEGYLWMSDEKEARVYSMKDVSTIDLYKNEGTFVIEAQLCDTEKHVSYSVKYIDGKHFIMRYEFSGDDFNTGTITKKSFVAHRINDINTLHFLQCWEPKEDPACLGMPVLHPTHLVFTGFTNAKTQEK